MVAGLYGLVMFGPSITLGHGDTYAMATGYDINFHPINDTLETKAQAKSAVAQKQIQENPSKYFKDKKQKNNCILVSVKNFSDLQNLFNKNNFDLNKVRCGRDGVPPLVLTKLPKDMGNTKNMKIRKKAFIKSMLPLILRTNEKIMEKRKKLLKLASKKTLSSQEKAWLTALAFDYNLKKFDIKELKKRVDIVPPSLFLAQAIMETGWGTSSAARHKKALFGVTLKSGVKSYSSLQASVDAYIHNLNYNVAYREMRDLRYKMRKTNQPLCSHRLIGKLLRYCERRMWYVKKVRHTISKNNLKQFDKSRLRSSIPA